MELVNRMERVQSLITKEKLFKVSGVSPTLIHSGTSHNMVNLPQFYVVIYIYILPDLSLQDKLVSGGHLFCVSV